MTNYDKIMLQYDDAVIKKMMSAQWGVDAVTNKCNDCILMSCDSCLFHTEEYYSITHCKECRRKWLNEDVQLYKKGDIIEVEDYYTGRVEYTFVCEDNGKEVKTSCVVEKVEQGIGYNIISYSRIRKKVGNIYDK